MRPASTSSDGVTDDGGVSAAGAPFAPVVGVLGAAPAGATVAGGCSGAGLGLAAALAVFGLAALAALAVFGLAAVAALVVAAAACDVAGFAFAAEDEDFVVDVFAAEALAVDGFAVDDLAGEDLAAEDFAVDDFAVEDLVAPDALAVPAFAVAGFAAGDFVVGVFAVEALAVDGFAVEDFASAGRTVRADVAARATLLAAVVALDRAALVVDGIAEDIALAASVNDLTAVSIALVAVLIACSAVVMVLAEDVAFVAAVFSCAAADVTLVAAVETVRADAPVVVVRLAELVRLAGFVRLADVVLLADVVRRAVAGRAALLVPVLALADRRAVVLLAAGLAVARVVVFFAALAVDDLAELVRLALAVRGRVGFFAAGVVGTDLPPSGSVTGGLIPRSTKFYTSFPLAHEPQQTLPPQRVASIRITATTSGPRPDSSRRRRAGVRQQPADSRDRLLRRRAAPDRNAGEIAAQRHRRLHHTVRDVAGQIKQFPLHCLGQHVANGDVERPGSLFEPRFHCRHRRSPVARKKPTADLPRSAQADHAEERTAAVALAACASTAVPSSPLR